MESWRFLVVIFYSVLILYFRFWEYLCMHSPLSDACDTCLFCYWVQMHLYTSRRSLTFYQSPFCKYFPHWLMHFNTILWPVCEPVNHSVVFTVGCTLRYHAAEPRKSHRFLTLLLIVVMSERVSYFQWCSQPSSFSKGGERTTNRILPLTLFQSLPPRHWNSLVSLQRLVSECVWFCFQPHNQRWSFSDAAGLFQYSRISGRKRDSVKMWYSVLLIIAIIKGQNNSGTDPTLTLIYTHRQNHY